MVSIPTTLSRLFERNIPLFREFNLAGFPGNILLLESKHVRGEQIVC